MRTVTMWGSAMPFPLNGCLSFAVATTQKKNRKTIYMSKFPTYWYSCREGLIETIIGTSLTDINNGVFLLLVAYGYIYSDQRPKGGRIDPKQEEAAAAFEKAIKALNSIEKAVRWKKSTAVLLEPDFVPFPTGYGAEKIWEAKAQIMGVCPNEKWLISPQTISMLTLILRTAFFSQIEIPPKEKVAPTSMVRKILDKKECPKFPDFSTAEEFLQGLNEKVNWAYQVDYCIRDRDHLKNTMWMWLPILRHYDEIFKQPRPFHHFQGDAYSGRGDMGRDGITTLVKFHSMKNRTLHTQYEAVLGELNKEANALAAKLSK